MKKTMYIGKISILTFWGSNNVERHTWNSKYKNHLDKFFFKDAIPKSPSKKEGNLNAF